MKAWKRPIMIPAIIAVSLLTVPTAGHAAGATVTPQTSNTWSFGGTMPTAREGLAVVTGKDGNIYAIGGQTSTGALLNTVEAYNPSTKTWTTKAPMPTARAYLAAAIASNGMIYAVGGCCDINGQVLGTLEAYNPSTDTWATGLASMPTPRTTLGAAFVSGQVYAVGGQDASTNPSSANEAYNPTTNIWTTEAPMPQPRSWVAVTRDSTGKVYAIGGLANNTPTVSNSVQVYFASSNKWVAAPNIPVPTFTMTAALGSNGVVYAIGGEDSTGKAVTATYGFDPVKKSWTTEAPMLKARAAAGATFASGKIYVEGGNACGGLPSGSGGCPTGITEVYQP